MKRRKLLLLLALPLGLLVALYVVAMLPVVQRAAALRAAARVPGLTLRLERLSVGWGSAEVRGLEAEYQGNRIRIPQLDAEYSGMAFLLRRELRVQSLAVPDFVLSASPEVVQVSGTSTAPVPASPAAAFAGFLAPITLPFPVAIDSAELAGRVELPAGRGLQFSVHGRLLAPGAEAAPAVRLDWTDAGGDAGALRELHWVGEVRIRETATGAISQLALDGVLAADAAAGSAGRGLRVNLTARHEAAGGPETVEASVRLPAAKPGQDPLVWVQVEHRPGDGRVTGDWSVRARRDQVVVLAPKAAWPEFTAEAKGHFSGSSATGDFATTGHATGDVSQLRKLGAAFAGFEALTGQMDFAVERTGPDVKLSKLEATVDSGSAHVLRVATLQPVGYRLDTGEVAFAQPENDLLRLEIVALPVAWLQPWLAGCTVEGREITGTFAVAAAADGRRVVLRAPQPLVLDTLTVRRAGKVLLDRARIALSPRIEHAGMATRLLVSDLVLTTEVGDRIDGTIDLNLDRGALTLDFASTVRGTLPTLLRPFAPVALGALQVEADLAGVWSQNSLALRTAKAALRRNGGGAVFAATALQPLTLRLSDGELVPERPGDPAARFEFGGLPLAWLQPWLTDATLDGTLGSGECRLQGAGRDWTVETLRPLAFSGVRYARGGRTIVEGFEGQLGLRANVRDDSWAVENLDLQLRPGALLAGGMLKVGLEAKQDAAGRGSLKLPMVIDSGGRHTAFRLEGEWSAGAAGPVSATARLTGDTVHLRDLSWLGALPSAVAQATAAPPPAPVGKKKPKTAAAVRPAKDERPFWAGLGGRLEVEVQRLVLEAEEITGVQAVAVCDAQHVALEKLSGRTKSAPLAAKIGVTFDSAKDQPYALQGDCSFPGFDLGALLRAAVPGEEPTVETVLDITAKVEGQGATLDDLVAGVRGDFVLKGGPGVLRIKDKRVEKAQALGGLVLGLLSKDKSQPAVTAGSRLLEELREFRFEQLDASLLRAEDLNLQVRTLDIRSANKRFTGSGVAKHVTGKEVIEYPLQLELRLAGKDDFAALLEQARLLDGTKDELGYLVMREPFPVSGTLVKPDWKKMLLLFGAGLAFGR
ncbi:MAG: hypothetical protein IPL39_06955 [Opitutaceae bacterium]|nr:hypothetical protein [Opitutaceae bacterium]